MSGLLEVSWAGAGCGVGCGMPDRHRRAASALARHDSARGVKGALAGYFVSYQVITSCSTWLGHMILRLSGMRTPRTANKLEGQGREGGRAARQHCGGGASHSKSASPIVHSRSPSTSSSHSALSGVGEAGGRCAVSCAEGADKGAVALLAPWLASWLVPPRRGEHGGRGSSVARCEGEGGGSCSGGSSGGSGARSLAPEAGPIAPLLPPLPPPPPLPLPRLLPSLSSPSAVRYIACSCCIRSRRCAGTDAAAAGLRRRAAAVAPVAEEAAAAEHDGPVADQGRCRGANATSGGSAGAAAAAVCGMLCGAVRVWLARPRLCIIGMKRGAQRSRLRIPSSSD